MYPNRKDQYRPLRKDFSVMRKFVDCHDPAERSFDGYVVDVLAVRATSGHCYSLGLKPHNIMQSLDSASNEVNELMPVGIHGTGAEFYVPIVATGLHPSGRPEAMMCSLSPGDPRTARQQKSSAEARYSVAFVWQTEDLLLDDDREDPAENPIVFQHGWDLAPSRGRQVSCEDFDPGPLASRRRNEYHAHSQQRGDNVGLEVGRGRALSTGTQ